MVIMPPENNRRQSTPNTAKFPNGPPAATMENAYPSGLLTRPDSGLKTIALGTLPNLKNIAT